ncbi:probable protein phosphatase 2C 33 [Trifolium pratense]|uniref:probable protein phosphatase 2C 33 n=1 Tax=Trifolium pratense TaxID=57577 RepID=UPI001E696D97|nr:probable protein phosphatase 2C 33 [Trifolium pratense]
MGSCLSGASSAPSSQNNTHYYYESPYKFYNNNTHDSNPELRLHRIPERIFLNGSSPYSSLFSKQGSKGINQDAMLLWENFGSMDDCVFCGVFDGHGQYGHVVAKKVRDAFPLKIMNEWNSHRGGDGNKNNDNNNNKNYNHFKMMRESFVKASKSMDRELKQQHSMDSYGSGTTAVNLIKKGQELVIANVGDSRAVLGTRDPDGSLIALQLTTDLKPNLPREAERIMMCKGRVFALENEGIARLWLPNVDSPGLAMARAFGDFCLKDFGLISIPEVSYRRLTDQDQFVVLATDGIWDVMSNEQVVNIVASAPRSSAAKLLVESAVLAWRTKLPSSKPDDCSAICLFFHPQGNSSPNTNTSIVTGSRESPYKTKQKHQ